jgi:hypothetical protein
MAGALQGNQRALSLQGLTGLSGSSPINVSNSDVPSALEALSTVAVALPELCGVLWLGAHPSQLQDLWPRPPYVRIDHVTSVLV